MNKPIVAKIIIFVLLGLSLIANLLLYLNNQDLKEVSDYAFNRGPQCIPMHDLGK